MRKTTERNRLKRMEKDARMLFMHGLITSSGLDSITKQCKAAFNKLKSLDVYRKIPKVYTDQTVSGALSTLSYPSLQKSHSFCSFGYQWSHHGHAIRIRAKLIPRDRNHL